ncbi:MAG TPA: CHAT domain-containing protein, partial [Longimicrobium sp.]
GGDRSLADEVRSIQACSHDRAAVRRLAAAHAAYSRAQPALWNREAERALREFDAALAGADASPALRAWSSYLRGVALFYGMRGKDARAAFLRSIAEVDTLRHPALAGRARWSLGTMFLRRGDFDASAPLLAGAARQFERAGEREHLGGVRYLEAEARFGLGDEEAAYAAMYRALHILRPYRGSLWLHNLLYVTSQAATLRGLNAASVRLQDEGVTVAARVRTAVHAEALLARAQARAAAGDSAGAAADLQASGPKLAATPPGLERSWHEQNARLTSAMLSIRARPVLAASELDSVVAFFSAMQAPIRVLPALAYRARAHLASGRPAAATADLDTAAHLLDGLSMNVESAALRASILDAARGVFDALAMSHARAGRPAEALAALEQGRASFTHGAGPRRAGARVPPQAPAGHVALEYALVGDTLLTFVVEGRAVHMVRRVVDRDTLLARAKHAHTALEVPALAAGAGPSLANLYDELIRPVSEYLRGGVPLVLVADGEIAAVPFAALRDTVGGRYLIEDRPLRFASTLRDAARGAGARAPTRGAALFVVDPAFEPRDHPDLQRLPETASGTRTIAAGYPRAAVLADTAAHPISLAAALGTAKIFHFAGHAVFDDARPDRSYLVLAPGRDGRARLTAADFGAMELRGLKLVVLSACQTQRSGSGRSGGFAGLSGALLAAGAGGVVGSLWRVDDALTRPLMTQFHRAYRASGDAAGALRHAQLRLLHSPDPALRSPAAWAGFRYAGV